MLNSAGCVDAGPQKNPIPTGDDTARSLLEEGLLDSPSPRARLAYPLKLECADGKSLTSTWEIWDPELGFPGTKELTSDSGVKCNLYRDLKRLLLYSFQGSCPFAGSHSIFP